MYIVVVFRRGLVGSGETETVSYGPFQVRDTAEMLCSRLAAATILDSHVVKIVVQTIPLVDQGPEMGGSPDV